MLSQSQLKHKNNAFFTPFLLGQKSVREVRVGVLEKKKKKKKVYNFKILKVVLNQNPFLKIQIFLFFFSLTCKFPCKNPSILLHSQLMVECGFTFETQIVIALGKEERASFSEGVNTQNLCWSQVQLQAFEAKCIMFSHCSEPCACLCVNKEEKDLFPQDGLDFFLIILCQAQIFCQNPKKSQNSLEHRFSGILSASGVISECLQ